MTPRSPVLGRQLHVLTNTSAGPNLQNGREKAEMFRNVSAGRPVCSTMLPTGCPGSAARLADTAPRAAGARQKRRQAREFWTDLHIDQHRAQDVGRFQDFQGNLKTDGQVKHDIDITSTR